MSEICKRCLAACEEPVTRKTLLEAPEGVCIVCWVRYGKFIPV